CCLLNRKVHRQRKETLSHTFPGIRDYVRANNQYFFWPPWLVFSRQNHSPGLHLQWRGDNQSEFSWWCFCLHHWVHENPQSDLSEYHNLCCQLPAVIRTVL